MPKVLAVIVTFHSQSDALLRLLRALAPQADGGIIVNNSAHLPFAESELTSLGFDLLQMPTNVGVASALNAGFDWAQKKGADFVITFDQDSEPAPKMVQHLMNAYDTLCAAGQRVGALGPQQVDSRTGQSSPFVAPVFLYRRKVIPATDECIAVDHLITSGCLVPMRVWTEVNPFLDMLFIDYVDVEWSLRVRHKGWNLYGVGGAMMHHAIGNEIYRVGARQFLSHNPHRHYYMFRNAVFLQKLRSIPLAWKIAEIGLLVKRFIFYTIFVRPRIGHLRFILLGLRDGLINRLGPLPNRY